MPTNTDPVGGRAAERSGGGSNVRSARSSGDCCNVGVGGDDDVIHGAQVDDDTVAEHATGQSWPPPRTDSARSPLRAARTAH
jgi:hypothetical protein